jgi:predicted phage terminase large subunit-like protein
MITPDDIPEKAVRPQPGPQTRFLANPADVVVYGGAAGGGKTWGLLIDALKYVDEHPDFGAVIFRRTYPEITGEDGIWEEAQELYRQYEPGVKVNESDLKFTFESGAQIRFAHLQHEKTKFNYKGSQIAYLGFDELSSFTRGQFFYMLSRNRSMSGVRPRVRGGTNPPEEGADHWLTKMLWWWLDTDEVSKSYGFPIKERAGKVRYFARDPDDELIWGNEKKEVIENAPHLKTAAEDVPGLQVTDLVKSFSFIPARVYDNELLLEENPEYLANLLALESGDQNRLLGGNWLEKVADGDVFAREDFEIVEPHEVSAGLRPTRHWDLAGSAPTPSAPNPDWTVGVKAAPHDDGRVFVLDARMFRRDPGPRDERIANVASQDGREVKIYIEQEPGQSGKSQVKTLARQVLQGFAVEGHRPSGPKWVRWQAPASAAQRGDVKLVRGPWNDRFLTHLDDTSAEDSSKKDAADALAQFWEKRMAGEAYPSSPSSRQY